jgi:hypothetical protein
MLILAHQLAFLPSMDIAKPEMALSRAAFQVVFIFN